MLGGRAFDALGPRVACGVGALMFTSGYVLIGATVLLVERLPGPARIAMPAVGCALAGYSSVSLLDNVVCMACSLSFPKDRAAIVGYLKAVLAAAAGLWALLWVHVFRDGLGLKWYIGTTACAALAATSFALVGLRVLPAGPDRRAFDPTDFVRLSLAITYTVSLALFSVAVSFCYSNGLIRSTPLLGYAGLALAALPLTLLPLPAGSAAPTAPITPAPVLSEPLLPGFDSSRTSAASFMTTTPGSYPVNERRRASLDKFRAAALAAVAVGPSGVRFNDAVRGADFWLLFAMQLAVFGGGVAANQNLALIFESARDPAASGLGVALFALASTVSRVSVGVLSDKFSS